MVMPVGQHHLIRHRRSIKFAWYDKQVNHGRGLQKIADSELSSSQKMRHSSESRRILKI